jgi:hypothetical protein
VEDHRAEQPERHEDEPEQPGDTLDRVALAGEDELAALLQRRREREENRRDEREQGRHRTSHSASRAGEPGRGSPR